MILINFAHPLTDTNLAELAALADEPIERELRQPAHFDHEQPLTEQVVALLDTIDLSADEWQRLPLVVNLPGYAPAAACVLAELHGRMGHFPTILYIRPIADSLPQRYAVADLINLQSLRNRARGKR